MNELLEWLRQQDTSVRLFSQFCEKALALCAKEPQHAAMARLLASVAGNFSETYFGEPLALDVAERSLARLTGLVEKAVQANSADLPQQIAVLNEIALTDLT
jgi:hypothetical protein